MPRCSPPSSPPPKRTAPIWCAFRGGIRANVAPGECRAVVAGLNAQQCAEVCKVVEHKTGVTFTPDG